MKFINLSGKRLLAAQVLEIQKMQAEVCEPLEEMKELIACNGTEMMKDYGSKAAEVITKFGIQKGDMVHINGIDFNLILTLRSTLPETTFVYSKIDRDKSNNHYTTNFICFVHLMN